MALMKLRTIPKKLAYKEGGFQDPYETKNHHSKVSLWVIAQNLH